MHATSTNKIETFSKKKNKNSNDEVKQKKQNFISITYVKSVFWFIQTMIGLCWKKYPKFISTIYELLLLLNDVICNLYFFKIELFAKKEK